MSALTPVFHCDLSASSAAVLYVKSSDCLFMALSIQVNCVKNLTSQLTLSKIA